MAQNVAGSQKTKDGIIGGMAKSMSRAMAKKGDIKSSASKDESPFEDSQKFKDAVNSVVAEKLNTIEKAKQFLPETYNFIDASTAKIMRDAVEKEHSGQTFEDSEIPVAFKMLKKKQSTQYKQFGDSADDAWAQLENKEI